MRRVFKGRVNKQEDTMYCQNCGASLIEGARFCAQCGLTLNGQAAASAHVRGPEVPQNQGVKSESVWMAVTAMVLAIVTLLALLSAAADFDTLDTLGQFESMFGGNTLQRKVAQDVINTAVGGLILGLPAAVLGMLSVLQRRGGRGMAVAGLVISAINLLLVLSLFGMAAR